MSLTGKDLLNTLSKLSEEELSRPVYVYADHGQEHYSADSIEVDEVATSLEYCLEEYYVHPSDLDGGEYEEDELNKFICIS